MAIGDKKSAVMQSDIVNDFTTGGATNVLSAEMGKSLAQRPNPNLLDNWYFGCLVDQRGGYVVVPTQDYYATASTANSLGKIGGYYAATILNTTWATFVMDGTTYYAKTQYCVRGYTGAGYGIDRWKSQNAAQVVRITNSGLEVHTKGVLGISQMIKASMMPAGTYTISALCKTNTGTMKLGVFCNSIWYEKTITRLSNKFDLYSVTVTIPDSTLNEDIMIANGSNSDAEFTILAAKLELGDTQTLAHQDADGNWVLNEMPNYNEELLKCCMSTADSTDTYANNKITPAAINAVNKSGDTMTGTLSVPAVLISDGKVYMEGDSNHSFIWLRNGSNTNNGGAITRYHNSDFTHELKYEHWSDGSVKQYDILHTGNKPSGSYTGNGDATTRTIDIGGIGNLLVIQEKYNLVFVLEDGAIVLNVVDGIITGFTADKINFRNGVLTISTAASNVNFNGAIYYYHVL